MGSSQYEYTNSRGVSYFLNTKAITLRGGKKVQIYYFSKDMDRPEATSLPEGKVVKENARNGFLTLKNV